MDHVAVMNKKFGDLIPKILSGEKKIESRWSKNKTAPWDKVHAGDRIYFKNSGGLITVVAMVERVAQFEKKDFNEARKSFPVPEKWMLGKNYCVLIWLKTPKKVPPFKVDKSGFGSAAAWLCYSNSPFIHS